MITWLQTFLLKHNKWLFSGLLVVIIVTFVLTIGNQGFGHRSDNQVESREYYGYDLNNPRDMQTLGLHAQISAQLHPDLGVNAQSIQQYAILRVTGLGLANDLGLPQPSEEVLKAFIHQLSVFKDPSSDTFSADRYNRFVDYMKNYPNTDANTLSRVFIEDQRIDAVRKTLAGPGYVLSYEAKQGIRLNETTFELAYAKTNYSDFQPEIEADPEAIQAYYSSNPAQYEVPEQIQVSAVLFDQKDFIAQVETPSEADLTLYFQRNSVRYQNRPDPTKPEAEVAEVTLEDVRGRVLSDLQRERASEQALTAADNFQLALYKQKVGRQDKALSALIAQYKGTLVPQNRYSREEPLNNRNIPPAVAHSMWIYTSGDRYYSDIGESQNGGVILLFDALHDPKLPSFEEVSVQAEKDWRETERRRLFSEKAQAIEESLKLALGEGTLFKEAAEAEGLIVSEPEPFKSVNAPYELRRLQLWDSLRALNGPGLTNSVLTQNELSIGYLLARTESAEDLSQKAEELLSSSIEQRARNSGWDLLGAWMELTLEQTAPDLDTDSESVE